MKNEKQSSELVAIRQQNELLKDEATILISQAIDKGVGVDSLERLLAMRRELKAEKSKEQYDQAMAAFQSECPIIEKKDTAGSGSYNYKYASLDHIVKQVKDLLAKNGFSYTFDTKKTERSLITYCKVKHNGGHMEVSEFEINIDTSSRMNISQKDGAANSYGKRYAFTNAFGILTGDEDNDVSTNAQAQYQKPYNPRQMADQVEKQASSQQDESMTREAPVKSQNSDTKTVSDKQKSLIFKLVTQKGKNDFWLRSCLKSKYSKEKTDELTSQEASRVITGLLTMQDMKKTENPQKEEPVDQSAMDLETQTEEDNIAEEYESHATASNR